MYFLWPFWFPIVIFNQELQLARQESGDPPPSDWRHFSFSVVFDFDLYLLHRQEFIVLVRRVPLRPVHQEWPPPLTYFGRFTVEVHFDLLYPLLHSGSLQPVNSFLPHPLAEVRCPRPPLFTSTFFFDRSVWSFSSVFLFELFLKCYFLPHPVTPSVIHIVGFHIGVCYCSPRNSNVGQSEKIRGFFFP